MNTAPKNLKYGVYSYTTPKNLKYHERKLLDKYGVVLTLKCLYENEIVGNGPATIACEVSGVPHWRTADALINLGRKVVADYPITWARIRESNGKI
jgi:hypothetical protein